jgi:hypothetical protein
MALDAYPHLNQPICPGNQLPGHPTILRRFVMYRCYNCGYWDAEESCGFYQCNKCGKITDEEGNKEDDE